MNETYNNKLALLGLLLLVIWAGCQPRQQRQQAASMSDAPSQSQQAIQPKIFFESTEYNFGQVPARSENQCFFEFSNIGDADLVIEDVKSTCGCTIAEPAKSVLKPGQSSEISAVYTAGSYGTVHKQITIYTNDPDDHLIINVSTAKGIN